MDAKERRRKVLGFSNSEMLGVFQKQIMCMLELGVATKTHQSTRQPNRESKELKNNTEGKIPKINFNLREEFQTFP